MDINAFQPINFTPIEVDDFSGGITDNYVGGAIHKYRQADNLLIEKYGKKGKLRLRPGAEIFDENHALVDSSNLTRIPALKYFNDQIFVFTKNKVYTQNTASVWTSLVGPNGGNAPFSSTAADGSHCVSCATWLDHLLVTADSYEYTSKIYKNSAGTLQIRTAGLPALASSPVCTSNSAGSNSYLYRFCYKYAYSVGTVQHIDRGALQEVTVSSAGVINTAGPLAITSIPVLSNTANTTLWDTANIDIEIYRTQNNGVNFYLVKAVDNGTTSTTDTMIDATLSTQEPLYTEGGVVENDLCPKAGLVHIVEPTNIGYYARIKDGAELLVNQLRQSVPGDVDSVPADFTLDLGDEIIGLSSYLNRPLLPCLNSAYSVDGAFDELGRGGMVAQKISDRCDCVSAASVVQTLYGVFWCGTDSFYFSDGYKVLPINLEWTESHKEFTSTAAKRKKIQGKYDRKNNRIWWTVQADGTASDCDSCRILHLSFASFGSSETEIVAPFTTASGGAAFRPTAIEFVDDTMYRGDESSYLLIHRETLATDPEIDTSLDASSWAEKAIIYTYESCAMNMGDSRSKKIAPKIFVKARNVSNLSLDIISINDDGRLIETLKPIRSRTSIEWRDPGLEWGDPDALWNYDSLISVERRFPRNSYRFSEKQIKLTNAYTAISNSDLNGLATVTASTRTVALNTVGNTFPLRVVGYAIAFESDGYVREYTIATVNTANTSITVLDPNSALPTSSAIQWVIRGYPKNEDVSLISYTIPVATLSTPHTFYRKGNTGEVGE